MTQERARSFGAVAADYDRLRPAPAAAAVDWLLPAPCRTAVDVGAGTGLFTRALVGRADRVVAVEPDERMRAVLAASAPTVTVLEGSGEELPLEDASADAVFVASAWHWMDADRATREVARVLVDGGRLGILWTSWDREIDWVDALHPAPPWASRYQGQHHEGRTMRPHRDITLPDDTLFTDAEEAAFSYDRPMPVDDVVEMVTTYSGFITAPPEEQQRFLDDVRRRLAERFPGADVVEVPTRSWCWRATRRPR